MSDEKLDQALDALLAELPPEERASPSGRSSAKDTLIPDSVEQPITAPSIDSPENVSAEMTDQAWNDAVMARPRAAYPRQGKPPRKNRARLFAALFTLVLAAAGSVYFLYSHHPKALTQISFLHAHFQENPRGTSEESNPADILPAAPLDSGSTNEPISETTSSEPFSPTNDSVPLVPAPSVTPEKTVSRSIPEFRDSLLLRAISGPVYQGKKALRFSCDLMLYSATVGLRQNAASYEEALRTVVANIFYFSGSENPQIPELEREILQKVSFIFPQGKIARAELRDLRLELVTP